MACLVCRRRFGYVWEEYPGNGPNGVLWPQEYSTLCSWSRWRRPLVSKCLVLLVPTFTVTNEPLRHHYYIRTCPRRSSSHAATGEEMDSHQQSAKLCMSWTIPYWQAPNIRMHTHRHTHDPVTQRVPLANSVIGRFKLTSLPVPSSGATELQHGPIQFKAHNPLSHRHGQSRSSPVFEPVLKTIITASCTCHSQVWHHPWWTCHTFAV